MTYWTGNWNPGREAISQEIAWLRRSVAGRSVVVACSPRETWGWDRRERVLRLRPSPVAYRAAASVVERLGEVTHVFGGLDSWYPLRFLGRRPLVVTLVTAGPPVAQELLGKVSVWVAETESLAEDARAAGVDPARVRLIRPGVDLERFTPAPPPEGPFTVLFASSPQSVEDMEGRGVHLLVETARLLPDVRFVLAWRAWGDRAEVKQAFERLAPPPNVEVLHGDVADMAALYRSVHLVAALFAPGHGKACPNSVIEGLACGRPAIVSRSSGLADLIQKAAAGAAVDRDASAVAKAIQSLKGGHAGASVRARDVAQSDIAQFAQAYGQVYQRCRRG